MRDPYIVGSDCVSATIGATRSSRSRWPFGPFITGLAYQLALALLLSLAGCSSAREPEGVEKKTSALTVPVPPVTSFAVLASRSASFGDRTVLAGGSVGVGVGTGTLAVGPDARIAVGKVLLAPRVTLAERSSAGELGANTIVAPLSATSGPRSGYLAPPAQPAPGTITPGTTPFTVNLGQTVTLAAGSWGAVTVNGVLNLSGGGYQFQSLRLTPDARVVALAPSVVRIAGVLTGLDRTHFLPSGAQPASALRLVVGGTSAGLVLGNDVQLIALVVARGDFRAGDRLTMTGAVAARDVVIGQSGQFNFGAGFSCGSNASCTDNNDCTTDACGDAECTHVAVSNGASCSDGNACTRTDRCQSGTCVGTDAVACVASDQCHAAGVCQPATGACSNPKLPDRTACTDGNACTSSDRCINGACTGSQLVCVASDTCHDVGVCDPSTAICSNPPRADGTCNGSGPPAPPFPPIPPRKLPKPPTAQGCYFYTASGWKADSCAAPGAVQAKFGIPTLGLSSNTFNTGPTTTHIPLVYGQVETLFPAVASVTDKYRPSICDMPPGTPHDVDTPNRWSIQANTNLFGPGNNNWVQFVEQSNGSTNAICVWQINGGGAVGDYHSKCYTPTSLQRAGGLAPFDSGNVAGFVDATAGTVSIVAQLSWVQLGQPTLYSVVDTDSFSLAGNWFQMDGSVVGLGCGSLAQFTDTEVITRLAVSSCPGDTEATSGVCPAPLLQPNVTIQSLFTTGESSNLIALTPENGPATFVNSDLAITNQISTTSGMCLGPDHIYIKDNATDNGGIPSNLGGQPFWESPDLFVVPHDTPVDVNAQSTETVITPGGVFDVYVRVHNDLGCNQITGAKALIYLADPSALSTPWVSITSGAYQSDVATPGGHTIAAGAQGLIGPFVFNAPTSGLGNGHKCLLAAVIADGEPAVANTFDAPNSNQVGQRNVQFSSCTYPLTNATSSDGSVQITLTASPPEVTPSLSVQPAFSFTFEDAGLTWFNTWTAQAGNGTTFAVSNTGGLTTVRLGTNSVVLNAVPLNAGESRNGLGSFDLPSGTTATLSLQATLTSASGSVLVSNGATCSSTGLDSPG